VQRTSHSPSAYYAMIRLGLCCIFRKAPIKFRTATATVIKRLSRKQSREKLAELCSANAEALMAALRFCSANGIGCLCPSNGGARMRPARAEP
jgi:UV DNA damage repair endonuclease